MATNLSSSEQTRLRRALDAVCHEAGLDSTGAELIKYTMNAVYRLDRVGVVVRMATGTGAAERVERVIGVATALANLGAPTVTLAPGLDHPVHVDGWSASIWRLLPQPAGRSWAPVDLALPLRAIHAISELPVPLPSWDPVAKSRRRLTELAGLDEAEHCYMRMWAADLGESLDMIVQRLHQWCDELDEAFDRIEWQLPSGVIHGDAHTGNLLVGPAGRSVLCDLDSVALGPREWDLTPAAHGLQRFGRDPAEYAAFAEVYGTDVTAWSGWDTIRQVRELQLVTSVIASVAGRPVVADELAHRLRSILAGDRATVWHRYR